MDKNPVTTVEQTSKRWKAMQLGGVVLICVAVVGFIMRADWAAGALAIGALLYGVGRLAAWWNHG